MHEEVVLVLAGGRRCNALTGEGSGQEGLADLASFDHPLQFPAGLGIVEQADPLLDHDCLDEVGQGGEVVHGLEAESFQAPVRVAFRPTTLLGRTGVGAVDAHRVRSARFQFQTIFHPDLVPPESLVMS